MSEFIDKVIAEATQAPETQIEPAAEDAAPLDAEGDAPQAKAEDDVPFPKKAVNAISRRDKQIGKYKAELDHARAELAKYQAQTDTKKPENQPPKEEDFDNFAEYLKASARFEAKQEFAENNKKVAEDRVSQQEQAWVSQREQIMVEKANELIQGNPEYKQLLVENADVLDSLPPHIERAFLEADNAALAFVALAKEGKLEALASMSPFQAAMEIGRAQDRGAALAKTKQVTQAPAPLSSAKDFRRRARMRRSGSPAMETSNECIVELR